MDVRRLFCLIVPLCLGTAALATSANGEQIGPVTGTLLGSFPIANDGSHILLPVDIAGRKARFVFDTGAWMHVIDTSLLAQIHAESDGLVEISSDGRTVQFPRFACPDLTLGTIAVRGSEPVCGFDFSAGATLDDPEFDGALGMPAWRRFVTYLDFDHARLSIFDADATIDREWESIDLTADSHVPVRIGNLRTVQVVDTGTVRVLLDRDMFRALLREHRLGYLDAIVVRSLFNEGVTSTFQIDKFQIGSFRIGDLVVAPDPFDNDGRCVLGLELLAKFQIVFDFPHARMYLKLREHTMHFKTDGVESTPPVGCDTAAPIPVAFDGDCPVALVDRHTLASGNAEQMVVAGGRCFLCSDNDAVQAFNADPKRYEHLADALVPRDSTHALPYLALHGYCPVSLVESGQWRVGEAIAAAVYGGRRYLCAGPAELEKFTLDAGRFVPWLHGIDVVSFVDNGVFVAGRAPYHFLWQDRPLVFLNDESRAHFLNAPTRYNWLLELFVSGEESEPRR